MSNLCIALSKIFDFLVNCGSIKTKKFHLDSPLQQDRTRPDDKQRNVNKHIETRKNHTGKIIIDQMSCKVVIYTKHNYTLQV